MLLSVLRCGVCVAVTSKTAAAVAAALVVAAGE